MIFFVVWAMPLAMVAARSSQLEQVDAAFQEFKVRFSRKYNVLEEKQRFTIFAANFEKINAHNALNLSYKLGVTRFSDMTQKEFASQTAGARMAKQTSSPQYLPVTGASVPDAIDWVSKGAITPVKDQGGCGSCWAFATTGAIEGAHFIQSGKLVSLSEQEFVSCYGKTCIAGSAWEALRWAANQSLCTETSYPYGPYPGDKPLPPISACTSSTCDTALPIGTISGYKFVTSKSESALMEAVSQQPVAVSVDAGGLSQYAGGIISGLCAQYRTDHAVLVVGYGSEGGVDYWKVKNSFGAKFGENGYFRVKRNDEACSNYKTGGLGILTDPVVPAMPSKSQVIV